MGVFGWFRRKSEQEAAATTGEAAGAEAVSAEPGPEDSRGEDEVTAASTSEDADARTQAEPESGVAEEHAEPDASASTADASVGSAGGAAARGESSSPAEEAAGESPGIPRQQSAEEAADSEAPDSARR
ncbi:hypothetical protein [Streptomyces sp. CC77]|uniref:hypothetical protein n=1 Tax=Streptomyces sp. CC77 TaxID=1906739 RepID=UPI0009A109EE|nr:hypothetical protein [Streptomyces sp. CC77]